MKRAPPAAANPSSTGSSPTYAARPSPRQRSSCDQAHGDGLSNEGTRGSQKTTSSKYSRESEPLELALLQCRRPVADEREPGAACTEDPELAREDWASSRARCRRARGTVRGTPRPRPRADPSPSSSSLKSPGTWRSRSRRDQSRAVASGSGRPLFSRSQATTAASAGRSKSRASKSVPSRSNAIRVSVASDASSSLVPSIGRPSVAATGLVFTCRSSPASNARPSACVRSPASARPSIARSSRRMDRSLQVSKRWRCPRSAG